MPNCVWQSSIRDATRGGSENQLMFRPPKRARPDASCFAQKKSRRPFVHSAADGGGDGGPGPRIERDGERCYRDALHLDRSVFV